MFQRLPIALAVTKRNVSNHFLCINKAKENTKKVYNNIMNSIKL